MSIMETSRLPFGVFHSDRNSPHVFTVETPTAPPVEDRVSMQRAAVQLLIQEHQILK